LVEIISALLITLMQISQSVLIISTQNGDIRENKIF
jgi:hypothetical protein